MTEKVAN
jgi:ABC-type multidrug transport system ATPase subunit